jgi:uncharacterized protein YraI
MKKIVSLALGVSLIPAAALAVPGSVSTDLQLRSGPGTNYGVITTIPAGAPINIDNCLDGLNWCQVTYGGQTGYSYARYLLADSGGGQTVVITENPSVVDVVAEPVVAVGEATGTVIGALGSAVGSVVGGVADVFTPDPEVVTYVRTNPVDPVYVDGEVVVGATVPDTVVLREVPRSEYRYAYVNGEPVLIEPSSRQIVYVYR